MASLREASPEHERLRLKCAWLGFQIAGTTSRFVAKQGSCAYSLAVKASLPEIIPPPLASPFQSGGESNGSRANPCRIQGELLTQVAGARGTNERQTASLAVGEALPAATDDRPDMADSKRLLVYAQKAANSWTPVRATSHRFFVQKFEHSSVANRPCGMV